MNKVSSNPPVKMPTEDSPTERADIEARLRLFDAVTARHRAREKDQEAPHDGSRGWTRDELYERSSGLFRVKDADTS